MGTHVSGASSARGVSVDAGLAMIASRDAIAVARERVAGVELSPAEWAAWFPMRMLEVVARVTNQLPAPSAPQIQGDVTLWPIALPPAETTMRVDEREQVCDEAHHVEPRVVCESDVVELRGVERGRWVFAWRSDGPPPRANLATPLRALARLGDRLCLRSMTRTLHTIELSVTARDLRALGEALALLTSAPRMHELVLVRAEQDGGELRAELSWPTDRVDRSSGDLLEDRWPARCGGRARLLEGDATSLRALVPLRGAHAQGALIERASRQLVVTVGDVVGDAEIEAITEQALRVRRIVRGRARSWTIPWSGAGVDPPRERRPPVLLPPEPARGLPARAGL
jgi:hypothetical protein